MQVKQTSLQDNFLNIARREKTPVIVFLTNGFQIRGLVKAFDNYTVVLDSEGKQQLIYKHALSTIVPLHPLNFMESEENT